MVSLATLVERIRVRYEAESGGSSVRFSNTDIYGYVNDGLEALAEETGYYERYVTISIEADRSYYDITGFTPEVVVSISSAWSSVRNDWLSVQSHEDLPYDWESQTGDPYALVARGIHWLVVYPKPTTTTGFFRVYFKGIPSRMNHPQAVLGDLPGDYTVALEDYALYEMAGADGKPEHAILFWSQYQKRQQSLKKLVKDRITGVRAGRLGGLAGGMSPR